MKKFVIVAISVITIAAAIFISSLPAANVNVTQTDLDQAVKTNGGLITREVSVSKGDTFKITLYSHWSAGMKWSAGADDINIVRQDGTREFANDGPPQSTGSPGREKWTFKALEKGETTIIMTYRSIAQLPGLPIVNTLKLKVIVK
jgi:predicted secreted protein